MTEIERCLLDFALNYLLLSVCDNLTVLIGIHTVQCALSVTILYKQVIVLYRNGIVK